MQAPLWQRRLPLPARVPCSYSEILQRYGYLDAEALAGLVKAWREIYRLVEPHAIVFEHAPTALLASRGFEAARVICGVGFGSPPRENPLPSFRAWETVARERLEDSDAQVLATVNAVLAKLRLRALHELAELFDADSEFLCTFPELDHYQRRDGASYCGSVFARDAGGEAIWPALDGKRIYVYLHPGMPIFHAAAEVLSDCDQSVLWVAPGVTGETMRRYASARMRFVRAPVRLAEVSARADAAVLYGSHGAVSAMLLSGVPMTLFPTHVEQALVARNAARVGAAVVASPKASPTEVRSALAAVLGQPRFRIQAAAFAAKYGDFDPKKAVARIAREVAMHCGAAGESD